MTLREMRERQQALVAEAREKLTELETDGVTEARAGEIEAEYDAIMAEHDRLDGQIQRRERLAEAERRAAEIPPDPRDGGERRGGDDDAAAPDAREAFRALVRFGVTGLTEDERRAVAELRVQAGAERRAQATSDTAGGYTIPEGFLPEITRSMALWGPMLDPGVTRIVETDSGNDLPWPTVDDTSNEGQLLNENTQVNEQDVTFGQKMLQAFLYSSKLVRVSEQLLQDSAFDMGSLLDTLFGERIGRICNRHLTVGTGTGQPNGIVTASAAGYTAAGAAAITFDDMIELEHSVDPAYRAAPGVRFMFHDSTLKALRKIKDSEGNYIWQPAGVAAGAPATILTHPYTINQAMAAIGGAQKSIVFGDFQKYIVRRVREYTMKRLVERYADYHQVGFLAFNRIDGELSDTAAVKHLVHPSD